jgi:hypothetical protein
MLDLEIARRHVRMRLDRLRRILLAALEIVFVDDLKRERVEDYLFEIFGEARRMVERDEAHLFGEREVEIEDTSMRAITSLIVDVPVRANVAPGMSAVYLPELLIQGSSILAAKRHKRHKIN